MLHQLLQSGHVYLMVSYFIQKQSPRGVPKNSCSVNFVKFTEKYSTKMPFCESCRSIWKCFGRTLANSCFYLIVLEMSHGQRQLEHAG